MELEQGQDYYLILKGEEFKTKPQPHFVRLCLYFILRRFANTFAALLKKIKPR